MSATSRKCLMLGAGIALIHAAFLPPVLLSWDGNSMLSVSESLVMRGDFTVPAYLGTQGLGGRYYSQWYPLLSILAIPFVGIGVVLAKVAHLPPHPIASIFGILFNAILVAATSSVTALMALRLNPQWRRAWLAGAAYGLCGIGMAYARTFFAEPLLALLTVLGLYWSLLDDRRAWLGASLCAALAILAKPTGVILGFVLVLYYIFIRKSWSLAMGPAAGAACGVALFALYNFARFGGWGNFGNRPGFGASVFPEAFAGLLISPGIGLLWFVPPIIALAALAKKHLLHPTFLCSAAILFLSLVLYSLRPHDWHGGTSWGPRYLLPALPGLLAATVWLEGRWRKLLGALCILGFLITMPNLFLLFDRYMLKAENISHIPPRELLWNPARTPILGIWTIAGETFRDAQNSDVRQIVRQSGKPDENSGAQAFKIIPVWWWMLPAAGVPRWIGAVIAAFMAAGGAWAIFRCRGDSTT